MNSTWQIKTLQELGTSSKGAGISKADILPEGLPCIRYAEFLNQLASLPLAMTLWL